MALTTVELQLDFNEASDLLALPDARLLEREGADAAYLISLDEGHVEHNLRLLTHAAGAALEDGWAVRPIPTDVGAEAGKTDDPEASAVFGPHAYVIGSHYGKKRGPLHPSRCWMARFAVDDLHGDDPVPVHVVRDRFRVNRIVNDALAASSIEVIEPVPEYGHAFVATGRAKGERKGKKWAARLVDGDHPINIEAAAFRENGNLLLGLRFPTTATGSPLLVELAGVPRMFEDGTWPTAVAAWSLEGAGTLERMVGFRALTAMGGDRFDAVLGNLDAVDKDSALLEHYPGGRDATSEHWTFTLPAGSAGGAVEAAMLERFETETRIEGLAPGPDGHMTYVVDEDHRVAMHFLRVD